MNPAKKLECDAVVANPPFSYRWESNDTLAEDFRFKSYDSRQNQQQICVSPPWLPLLSDQGTMAIILPHGVLFRVVQRKNKNKLLKDGKY